MTEQEQLALLEGVDENTVVFDSVEKAMAVLGDKKFQKIMVSVSGGADSDILIDLCSKIRKDLIYVWYNTGMEYQATKDHLRYLEERYGIEIIRVRADKPVPLAVKTYGYPFLSKQIAMYIGRLQKYGFKFEDKPFEELYKEYPKCKSALRWWCNKWGEKSSFNINRWKYLKEFLIENPPAFRISDGCCTGAKKNTSHNYRKQNHIDLVITGVRKAEGGARAGISNCFTDSRTDGAVFRPIFWYRGSDREWYEERFDIRHSKCYWMYKLDRTGCVGCPFGRNWEHELEVVKQYEPRLHKLCQNVFGRSYEYTREYWKFRKHKEAEAKGYEQLSLFD